MPFRNPNDPRPALLRIWLFVPPGAGDLHQLDALAAALGGAVQRVEGIEPVGRVVFDRLRSLFKLPAGVPERLQPPWPDLALLAGGRSVVTARRLARCSGGRTKLVCIGRPWAPLHWFDLVVTTPQYRLPPAANVAHIELPLNRPNAVDPETLDHWRNRFADLPRPLLGVLLGGDSGSFRFTAASAGRIAAALRREQDRSGGSLVVVGSPRTPAAVFEQLNVALNGSALLFPWAQKRENPYRALLDLADALAVTGDSASMLAEACFSGRPVALLPLEPRLHTRILSTLRRITSVFEPVFAALTRRGLWIPARDLDQLHDLLRQRGWLRPLDGISHAAAVDQAPDSQALLERIACRITTLWSKDGAG